MNNNNENKVTKKEDVAVPVSPDEYKENLKELSRAEIIESLIGAGATQEDATEWADEFDKDRE